MASPTEVFHSGLRLLRWRGAGFGAPLVFLHGIGDGADVWDPVINAFPNGPLASIAPDLPGHGGSEWLKPRQYTVASVAARVAAAIESEAIRRPILIGHSLGGRVALELAAAGLRPERVVLIDVNPDAPGSVGDAVDEHLDALHQGAPDMETFIKSLAARLPLADPAVLASVVPALSAATQKNSARACLEFDPEIKRLLDAPNQTDGWGIVAALECPLSVIRGGFSSALDASTAATLVEKARKPGRNLTVEGAGHAIAFEQPARLAAAIAKAISAPA